MAKKRIARKRITKKRITKKRIKKKRTRIRSVGTSTVSEQLEGLKGVLGSIPINAIW